MCCFRTFSNFVNVLPENCIVEKVKFLVQIKVHVQSACLSGHAVLPCTCINQNAYRTSSIAAPMHALALMHLALFQDGDILASRFPPTTEVAYILSLGVMKEYRRAGVG